jgi:UDP-glucose 4-epimerase
VGLKVLVTGASGFIASNLIPALLEEGFDVVGLDKESAAVSSCPHLRVDLTDPAAREQLARLDFSAVVHLAGLTRVLESLSDPTGYFANNVVGTAAVLEAARERGGVTFVLASTNAVAGDVEGVIDERVPPRPLTPYGATKAAAEALVSGWAKAYGMRHHVLRLTNVYGPYMHRKDSFVARLIRAARAGGSVTIYGDGLQRRDLVHVRVVVDAVKACLLGSFPEGVTVVGSGHSPTVLELVEAFERATGVALNKHRAEPKAGEMRAVVVDNSRLKGAGIEPRVPLEEGLRDAFERFFPPSTSS